jgi:hypothetical protein
MIGKEIPGSVSRLAFPDGFSFGIVKVAHNRVSPRSAHRFETR